MKTNRAWKRVALAVATLLPTLIGVTASTVDPASADPPPEQDWWNRFDGLGLTKLDMRVDVAGDYWKAFAIVHPQQYSTCDAGTNLANQVEKGSQIGGQTTFAAGSTGNFCIEVNEGWAGSSTWNLDFYTTATFKLKRNDDGATLPGSYTMTNPGGWHNQQSASIPVQMDAEPFDGAPDAPLATGWYEMSLELRTQNQCTPDPCTSQGGGRTYHYGRGYIYVSQGYLYGAHPAGNSTSELSQEQSSTGINKNMSLVRDYKPDWAVPSARVNTWASEGKSVVWSAKPPAWSGGQSPWARAAADTTTIDNQIRSLQASANQTGGPSAMFYAVSHEPHDNASDTTQGWNNGASNRKCGTTTSPSASDGSHDACLGTTAEFKALYHQMRLRQQTACNGTGGTTGTLGSPCNKVHLIYIGTTSNLTPGATVGADDPLRPATEDFDLFGGDVFNWGCFRKAAGTCTDSAHGNNNEWKDFQYLVDDPTSNNSLLDLAQFFDKAAVITELGSHPGCNASQTSFNCNGANTAFFRSTWFQNMDSYLTYDMEANRYLLGYVYFHDNQTHDWRFIDTTAGGDVDNRGLVEYKAAVADTVYRSTAVGYDASLRTPVPDGLLYVGAGASPAYYYSGPAPAYERNHKGTGLWTPRSVDFNSGWDTTNNNAWMVFGFDWHQPQQKLELNGRSHSFEIGAEVDCAWARAIYSTGFHPEPPEADGYQGYRADGWNTNIPATALPYEDTIFNAQGNECNGGQLTGRAWFGIGVLNAKALNADCQGKLNAGQPCHYFARVALANGHRSDHTVPAPSSVRVRTKANTVFDATGWQVNLALPELAGDCDFNGSQIGNWNSPTQSAQFVREEASWCSWNDWKYEVRADGLMTGQLQQFPVDALYNQGMEEGGATPTGYSLLSGGPNPNWRKYCNDSAPAFDGGCFVQYNNGGNGQFVSIYQDRQMNTPSGYEPTHEVAVRCRSGSFCNVNLTVWGLAPNQENRNVSGTVPNDGRWYLCRLDHDHGSSPFAFPHQTLKWEVYNLAVNGGNMDLDYTFLSAGAPPKPGQGQAWRDNPDAYSGNVGVGQANAGPPCQML